MDKIITSDLSDFGYRELNILSDLIAAMQDQGLPEDFEADEVTPMLNLHSGNVFLINAEYQVAMIDDEDGKLKSFYTLFYYGTEGFLDELIAEYDAGNIGVEDFEELADICEVNGYTEKAQEIRRENL